MDNERDNIQTQQCTDPCCNKEFLDYEGLQVFHEKTKEYTDAGDQLNAESIDGLDERVTTNEKDIIDLEGLSNEFSIAIEDLRFIIEHQYPIISGVTYKISEYPKSGETDTLITSEGIYYYTNAKTAYVECSGITIEEMEGSGLTYPVYEVYIPGYDTTTTGGELHVKMLRHIGNRALKAYLQITTSVPSVSGETYIRTLKRQLFLNGRPADFINTWRAGDTLRVWYDGTVFQSTFSHVERPQSKYALFFGFDEPDAKDHLDEPVLNYEAYEIQEPIRKGSGYYGTCVNTNSGQRLYILVPEDVEIPEMFTVGGIELNTEYPTVNDERLMYIIEDGPYAGRYYPFYSTALYAEGARLRLCGECLTF